jgi:hypothetical protein
MDGLAVNFIAKSKSSPTRSPGPVFLHHGMLETSRYGKSGLLKVKSATFGGPK